MIALSALIDARRASRSETSAPLPRLAAAQGVDRLPQPLMGGVALLAWVPGLRQQGGFQGHRQVEQMCIRDRLLDEPSMGLAPLMVEKVFEVVRTIASEGVTILLIEQNARLALENSHRGYVMESGEITLSGPARDMLHDPKVRAAYLDVYKRQASSRPCRSCAA